MLPNDIGNNIYCIASPPYHQWSCSVKQKMLLQGTAALWSVTSDRNGLIAQRSLLKCNLYLKNCVCSDFTCSLQKETRSEIPILVWSNTRQIDSRSSTNLIARTSCWLSHTSLVNRCLHHPLTAQNTAVSQSRKTHNLKLKTQYKPLPLVRRTKL